MDEILKDADVLHHTLGDPTKAVKEHEIERYNDLMFSPSYMCRQQIQDLLTAVLLFFISV